ncbi:MAG: DUF4366 domain-containing protein [Ruminococcus sp.]|nr:DUF4366 domain-containing protein [Ruminococcus sp.]
MNKRFFSAIISAVLLATASVGITASAEETVSENQETTAVTEMAEITEKPEETTITDTAEISENQTETTVTDTSEISENPTEITDTTTSETMENPSETTTTEKTTVDYFNDDYYDTAGNATLIKEESIIYDSEEMQFIAVTTKDGHVFYVLINYSAESGEDAVYFLNKVDDYDLYALLYAGDEENNITPEQALQAAENANGRVQNNSENPTENSSENTENEEVSEPIQTPKNSMNMNMIYLVVGVVVLVAIGFMAMKFMKKPKKNVASEDENYDFYEPEDDEE